MSRTGLDRSTISMCYGWPIGHSSRNVWTRPASVQGFTIRLRFTSRRPMKDLAFSAGDFPVAEKAVSQVLSLPMFPDLTLASRIVLWPKC